MILILVIVDNGLVRACFRSNNVLLCLVLILVVVDNGLVHFLIFFKLIILMS